MDQQLKENLPIFTVLILGGTLILALSGVILYQQFRDVGTELATVEPSKTQQGTKKTQPEAPVSEAEVSLAGTWEMQDPRTGQRTIYRIQDDGSYTTAVVINGSEYLATKGTVTYNREKNTLFFAQTQSYAKDGSMTVGSIVKGYDIVAFTRDQLCIHNTLERFNACLTAAGSSSSEVPNFTEKNSNSIIGTWESEHQKMTGEGAAYLGGEGAEFYAKFIFSADGTFQYYLVNSSMSPPPFRIAGAYQFGTYKLDSGPVEAIYFKEHASATYPFFDYGIYNFRLNSSNQFCFGDRVGGLGSQWICFNRVP